jgi:hypothetical protein
MPRRRARAGAADADSEHGLVMGILLHSPKDTLAVGIAASAIVVIIANALFFQAGRHPAPMFGSVTTLPAVAMSSPNPLPRPRPVEAASQPESRSITDLRLTDPKAADPLGNLVKTTSAVSTTNIPRLPATTSVAHIDGSAGSRKVAAVQRALTDYGYGQLKPTGVVGSDTQAAIQKFERTRKIPVTGQVSDRLVHELVVVIGHPIE